MNLTGSSVAIVTPMHATGEIDFEAFKRLLDQQIAAGTQSIVVLGTTGEAPTITAAERVELVQVAVAQAAGRVPVIVGTGSNSTESTIALTQQAKELGADACLLATPYYNKPTQEGLYQHFAQAAKSVDIPQVLYNVPARTGVDLLPETVARLHSLSNIVAIKEASGELDRVQQLRDLGVDFPILTGKDELLVPFLQAGGDGVISVLANVLPEVVVRLCRDQENDLFQLALPLIDALFCESNPIPVKWLLAELGQMPAGIRLPLTPLSESMHASVRSAYDECVKNLGEL